MSQKARSKCISLAEFKANKEKTEKTQSSLDSKESQLNQSKSRYSTLDQIKMTKVTADLTQLGLIPEEKNLAASMNSQEKTKQQELNIIKALVHNGQESAKAFPSITTSSTDLQSYLRSSASIAAIASTVALAHAPKADKEAIGETQSNALGFLDKVHAFFNADPQEKCSEGTSSNLNVSDNNAALEKNFTSQENTVTPENSSAYSRLKEFELLDKMTGIIANMFANYSDIMTSELAFQAYTQGAATIMAVAGLCAVAHIPEVMQKIKDAKNQRVFGKTLHEPSQAQQTNTIFGDHDESSDSAKDTIESILNCDPSNSSDASMSDYSLIANNAVMQFKHHVPYMLAVFKDTTNQMKNKFFIAKDTTENSETTKIPEKAKQIEQNKESIPLSKLPTETSGIAPETLEKAEQVEENLPTVEKTAEKADISTEAPNEIEQKETNIPSGKHATNETQATHTKKINQLAL